MNKIATLIAIGFALSTAAAQAADAPATDGKVTQQTRMKTCNTDAKGKHGDERKAFMKSCLSSGKKVAKK